MLRISLWNTKHPKELVEKWCQSSSVERALSLAV
jgi:hypothetical protein